MWKKRDGALAVWLLQQLNLSILPVSLAASLKSPQVVWGMMQEKEEEVEEMGFSWTMCKEQQLWEVGSSSSWLCFLPSFLPCVRVSDYYLPLWFNNLQKLVFLLLSVSANLLAQKARATLLASYSITFALNARWSLFSLSFSLWWYALLPLSCPTW